MYEYRLRSEWRSYNWDRMVALSAMEQGARNKNDDLYYQGKRTAKLCEVEMERLVKKIIENREEREQSKG